MNLRKIMHKLHLWLALPSAIVLFIVCITGSIFTYADEIMDFMHRPYSEVAVGANKQPVESILKTVRNRYPDDKIASMVAYTDKSKSYKMLLYSEKNGLRSVFADPYSGQILGESRAHQFFYVVAHLHSELLLGEPGAWIVKIATVIFLILIITGIVLWWPKKLTRKNWKNFFAFNHKFKFKRIVYDHHRVLGMYAAGVLLLLALTGTIMAFKPIEKSLVKALGGGRSEMKSRWAETETKAPLLSIIEKYSAVPGVEAMRIGLASRQENGIYKIAAGQEIGILTYSGAVHFVDKVSGEELTDRKEGVNAEVENMLMSLHSGKWLGWFGELLTFLSGIIGAYLIVTGVIIWWNRRF